MYITTEVEVDIDVQDIYERLDDYEIKELLELIKNKKYNCNSKDYFLQNMIGGQTDTEILTNKEFLSNLIKLLKYETPDLLEFVKEEINY